MDKIQLKIVACVMAMLGSTALAAPMAPAAKTVIPSAVQRIISLDYSNVKQSETALALKAQVLPDDLMEFEKTLRSVGISPERDLESLTFASFPNSAQKLKMIAVASGSFSSAAVLKKVAKTVRPVKYRESDIYPMSKDLSMTFLDNSTLLFGDPSALLIALNVRSGDTPALDSNQKLGEVIESVDKAVVWSVLDAQGAREMLLSALGVADAGKLATYARVQKLITGSHYTMNFDNGVSFDLEVLTEDSATSATLSSLLQGGMLFKNVIANPAAKIALKNMKVSSDRSDLQIHFKTDPEQLQKLLQAQFFAVVSATPVDRAEVHP